MNQTERFYKIDQLLNGRKVVPIQTLMAALGVSRATFKRDLAYLRDRFNAPIIFDRYANGYRFDTNTKHVGTQYELPGLWSLPDRQLRNSIDTKAKSDSASLPDRQLRNRADCSALREVPSLPGRQLRKRRGRCARRNGDARPLCFQT